MSDLDSKLDNLKSRPPHSNVLAGDNIWARLWFYDTEIRLGKFYSLAFFSVSPRHQNPVK